jgi:hypothetical protein
MHEKGKILPGRKMIYDCMLPIRKTKIAKLIDSCFEFADF